MGLKSVQFQSNTKKDLDECYVKGSNGIYYFQFSTGTNRNLREELKDHLIYKLTGQQPEVAKTSTIGEYVWGLYKRGIDPYTKAPRTDNEFLEAIENHEIAPLGDTFIIPTGRDYTQVDQNGNILVASVTSHLENEYDGCGNILIDGQTGNTIRKSRPNVIINSCQKSNGFYPIEIYLTTTDQKTGEKRVSGREFNFLTPEGKLVKSDFGFTKVPHDEQFIYTFNRNFYSRHNGSILSDWNIYPKAYVLCSEKTPYFFNGEWEVIAENRKRLENGEDPIVQDETPYILNMYLRKAYLDEKTEELGKAFDDGKLNHEVYNDALRTINEECEKLETFLANNETFEDISIRDNLDFYKEQYPNTPAIPLESEQDENTNQSALDSQELIK